MLKLNLEDDKGVVIQGAGGGLAPITVGITMPGFTKPMTPGPTARSVGAQSRYLDGEVQRGYTSDQIKRVLQKQREQISNEERNLKPGCPRLSLTFACPTRWP